MDSEDAKDQTVFRLSSVALVEDEAIPAPYACKGETSHGRAPDLRWSAPPEGTRSMAVTVIDVTADDFVHWVVLDVPPSVHELADGARGERLPEGAFELLNNFGESGYGGPCPPPDDGPHVYVFSVYALPDRITGLAEGSAAPRDLDRRLRSRALASASIKATYDR